MTIFILAANSETTRARIALDSDAPADDRLRDIGQLLELSGLSKLSTTHLMHAIAGPDHAQHETAVRELRLETHYPCDSRIVRQAVEMLAAGELIEPSTVDDPCLSMLIAIGFASESDWEDRARTAEATIRSWLTQHFEDFPDHPEQMNRDHLTTYAALSAGLVVAISKARADWTP